MKLGDLVRIKKTSIDARTDLWAIDFADAYTPLLVVEVLERFSGSDTHLKLLGPGGTICYVQSDYTTKRMRR